MRCRRRGSRFGGGRQANETVLKINPQTKFNHKNLSRNIHTAEDYDLHMKKKVIANEIAKPIIRWAGSKTKILPKILEKYRRSGKAQYIEPFCGSACLFFAAQPASAVISDFNKELIEVYEILRHSPLHLHSLVSKIPKTETSYYRLREKDPRLLSKAERAARFVYLNRFCFNGIFRTNRTGAFNVPRGHHTGSVPNIEEFRRASKALKSTLLIAGDFELAIKHVSKDSFVYLDPPYAYADRRDRGEYGVGSFTTKDIARLHRALDTIDKKGAHFLLSYANKSEIDSIRNQWGAEAVSVKRQIAGFGDKRKVIEEVLIKNF